MPSNIMPTLTALKARRIVRTNYFKSFVRMADKILKGSAFAGDPHAFVYPLPKGALPQAEFLKKAALMSVNKYPGDVEKLRVKPPFGPYRASAFIQRVIVGEQEILKLSRSDGATEFKPAMVKETIERVLDGEVMWEHMVGGKAARMAINTEKFILSPQDMFDRYCQFYNEVRQEADKNKIKVNESSLDKLLICDKYFSSALSEILHFIQYSCEDSTYSESSIKIEGSLLAAYYRIVIRDNCSPPISEEVSHRLSSKITDNWEYQGHYIGLALSSVIMQHFSGALKIFPIAEKGNEFQLLFPSILI